MDFDVEFDVDFDVDCLLFVTAVGRHPKLHTNISLISTIRKDV